MLNFLEAFWEMHCQPDDTGAPGSVAQDGYGEMSDFNFQASLEAFFGGKCKPKKIEEVDMQRKLEAAGLLQLFGVELWPSSAAVRDLATQMKTRTGSSFLESQRRLGIEDKSQNGFKPDTSKPSSHSQQRNGTTPYLNQFAHVS